MCIYKDGSPHDNIETQMMYIVYVGAEISCRSWRDREKFSHLWENIYCSCSLQILCLTLCKCLQKKEKIPHKNLPVEVLCCCILIAVDFHNSWWNLKLLSTPESARNHEGTNIASNIFISMEIKMTLSIKSTMDSTKAVLWMVPKISLPQS